MKCLYARALAERAQERINQQEQEATLYVRCLALKYLHDERKMSWAKLQSIIDEMYIFLAEQFGRYRDDSEAQFDARTVPFILQGTERTLEAMEIPYDEVNKEFEWKQDPRYMTPRLRQKHELRYEMLYRREVCIRPYWYGLMIVLNSEAGFGKKRLTEFYRAVRKEYHRVWLPYLECKTSNDNFTVSETRKTIAEIEKHIKVIGNDDTDEKVVLDLNE